MIDKELVIQRAHFTPQAHRTHCYGPVCAQNDGGLIEGSPSASRYQPPREPCATGADMHHYCCNNIAILQKTTKVTLRNKTPSPELTDTQVQAGFLCGAPERHGLHGPVQFPLEYKQYRAAGECIAPFGIDDDMIILWSFGHTGKT